MIATHKMQDISFGENTIALKIDGKQISIQLDKLSEKLKAADGIQKNFYKISPSGYGIHWPLIDEDLSVDTILKIAG